MSSQIIFYVKSTKTIREVREWGYKEGLTYGMPTPQAHGNPYSYYDVDTTTKNVFVLPEDQQRIVEDAKELASKYGLVVKVVDLTKEGGFSRWRLEHSKKIKTLPALVTGSGETKEGIMTKEQIEAFLYRASKSAT